MPSKGGLLFVCFLVVVACLFLGWVCTFNMPSRGRLLFVLLLLLVCFWSGYVPSMCSVNVGFCLFSFCCCCLFVFGVGIYLQHAQ